MGKEGMRGLKQALIFVLKVQCSSRKNIRLVLKPLFTHDEENISQTRCLHSA
jgi:hypothetical protein